MEVFMVIGKIEKGISIKPLVVKKKYPLSDMVVGDSFLITLESGDKINTIRCHLYKWGEENKKKFSMKRISFDQIRVWRIL